MSSQAVQAAQAAPGFHLSSGQVHIPRQKGICAVCNLPVLDDQLRSKNQQGKYVHSLCAAVGGAQVVTQVHTPHQKGICAVCGMPVLVDQARTKNQSGAYVHAQCQPLSYVHGLCDNQIRNKNQQGSYSHNVQKLEEHRLQVHIPREKGFCAVCWLPVFDNQSRTKNQQGAYVHGLCDHPPRTKNQQGAYVQNQCAAVGGAALHNPPGMSRQEQMPHKIGGLADKHRHCGAGGPPNHLQQTSAEAGRDALITLEDAVREGNLDLVAHLAAELATLAQHGKANAVQQLFSVAPLVSKNMKPEHANVELAVKRQSSFYVHNPGAPGYVDMRESATALSNPNTYGMRSSFDQAGLQQQIANNTGVRSRFDQISAPLQQQTPVRGSFDQANLQQQTPQPQYYVNSNSEHHQRHNEQAYAQACFNEFRLQQQQQQQTSLRSSFDNAGFQSRPHSQTDRDSQAVPPLHSVSNLQYPEEQHKKLAWGAQMTLQGALPTSIIMPVFDDQTRNNSQQGAYVHSECESYQV
jgi:hypothetical protein